MALRLRGGALWILVAFLLLSPGCQSTEPLSDQIDSDITRAWEMREEGKSAWNEYVDGTRTTEETVSRLDDLAEEASKKGTRYADVADSKGSRNATLSQATLDLRLGYAKLADAFSAMANCARQEGSGPACDDYRGYLDEAVKHLAMAETWLETYGLDSKRSLNPTLDTAH